MLLGVLIFFLGLLHVPYLFCALLCLGIYRLGGRFGLYQRIFRRCTYHCAPYYIALYQASSTSSKEEGK
jgi:hypothetical protein